MYFAVCFNRLGGPNKRLPARSQNIALASHALSLQRQEALTPIIRASFLPIGQGKRWLLHGNYFYLNILIASCGASILHYFPDLEGAGDPVTLFIEGNSTAGTIIILP